MDDQDNILTVEVKSIQESWVWRLSYALEMLNCKTSRFHSAGSGKATLPLLREKKLLLHNFYLAPKPE